MNVRKGISAPRKEQSYLTNKRVERSRTIVFVYGKFKCDRSIIACYEGPSASTFTREQNLKHAQARSECAYGFHFFFRTNFRNSYYTVKPSLPYQAKDFTRKLIIQEFITGICYIKAPLIRRSCWWPDRNHWQKDLLPTPPNFSSPPWSSYPNITLLKMDIFTEIGIRGGFLNSMCECVCLCFKRRGVLGGFFSIAVF